MDWKIGLIAAVAVLILVIIVTGYVKAPPDMAYIISGMGRKKKILIGRAGIKIPFLERKDTLLLKQISIDIKTNGYVPTNDFIGVDIDAVAKVRIMTDQQVSVIGPTGEQKFINGIELASRNFLNMREPQIIQALTDSLQGNMREIIGTINLRDLNTDRKRFGDEVQEKAQKDMNALGVEIISCNIQRVEDENGLINALGQDNMSQIQKDASIAKANADRDVAIAQAEAAKAANEAKVSSDMEIAQRNNELALKRSALEKEAQTAKAVADAAYKIQSQEQERTIQTATVNAQIARAEREAELKRQEVDVQQQTLTAEINKKADAERYRVEQSAAAELTRRQKVAEAQKYEQEQDALAKKAQADAAKYVAMQEAEGIRAKGEAEAQAIRAKALAEADGMEKKAEAYNKYNKAAMAEMMIKVLPQVAAEIAKPLSAIDKVTIIGGGEGGGSAVTGLADGVPQVMAKLFASMKEATGVDLSEIMKADTYDAKVKREVTLNGLPEINVKVEGQQPTAAPEEPEA